MNVIYCFIILVILILYLIPKKFSKSHFWWEENKIIYFFLTSNGTTGPGWIERLENQGIKVSADSRKLLLSQNFIATSNTVYKIAVIRAKYFKKSDCTTRKIRKEARRKNFKEPNIELACLIREKFSAKELRAVKLSWIIAMHKPIDGFNYLLGVYQSDDGNWLVDSKCDVWPDDSGFAFEAPYQNTNSA